MIWVDFRKSSFEFLWFDCLDSVAGNLGRRELGDSLGSLGDGVLGELTRKHETNSSLDLSGGEGGLLVVSGELSGFTGDTLKDIVDE